MCFCCYISNYLLSPILHFDQQSLKYLLCNPLQKECKNRFQNYPTDQGHPSSSPSLGVHFPLLPGTALLELLKEGSSCGYSSLKSHFLREVAPNFPLPM